MAIHKKDAGKNTARKAATLCTIPKGYETPFCPKTLSVRTIHVSPPNRSSSHHKTLSPWENDCAFEQAT